MNMYIRLKNHLNNSSEIFLNGTIYKLNPDGSTKLSFELESRIVTNKLIKKIINIPLQNIPENLENKYYLIFKIGEKVKFACEFELFKTRTILNESYEIVEFNSDLISFKLKVPARLKSFINYFEKLKNYLAKIEQLLKTIFAKKEPVYTKIFLEDNLEVLRIFFRFNDNNREIIKDIDEHFLKFIETNNFEMVRIYRKSSDYCDDELQVEINIRKGTLNINLLEHFNKIKELVLNYDLISYDFDGRDNIIRLEFPYKKHEYKYSFNLFFNEFEQFQNYLKFLLSESADLFFKILYDTLEINSKDIYFINTILKKYSETFNEIDRIIKLVKL